MTSCIHCGGTIIYSDGRCFMCGRLQQPDPVIAPRVEPVRVGFGETIKDYRREHKLTQVQLAKILDVSPSYISYWEVFNRTPQNAKELLDKLNA